MHWEGLYSFPILAALISGGLAAFISQQRDFSGRTGFLIMLLGAAEWSLGVFFEITADSLAGKIVWDNLQFIGYTAVFPGVLLFVLAYRRNLWRAPKWLIGGLLVEPVVTNLLAWTNGAHALIRVNPRIELFEPFSLLTYGWGPWMWISTIYGVLLYAVSLAILLRRIYTERRNRQPVPRALLVGFLIPWVWGLLLLTGILPGRLDLSPLLVALAGALITRSIFREELFPLSSYTYQSIVNNAVSGIVVLDSTGCIVNQNPAAAAFLETGGDRNRGRRFLDLCSRDASLENLLATETLGETEITVSREEAIRYYQIRTQPIPLRGRGETGRLIFVDDITRRKQTEEELRKSTERFESLSHNLADTVFFYGYTTDGVMTYLSEGGGILGPVSPEEAGGRHAREIAAWTEDSIPVERYYRKQLASGALDAANFVLSYTSPQGETRYVSFYEYAVRDDLEEKKIIEGVGIDITKEKETERELATMGMVTEYAQVSVLATDTDGRIEYVNPFFCSLTGYGRDEVIGRNPKLLKSGFHDDAFYRQMWATLTRGETWRGELRNRKKDGSLYWEKAIISPIRNEHDVIIRYVGIKEDITGQKQFERLKEDVDRITHHDIRTPLNTIIGLPEVLLRETNLTDEQKEDLALISHAGRNVLEAMNLSMTILRIEAGSYRFEPERLDLAILVKQCAREQKAAAATKGVRISITAHGFNSTEMEHIMVLGDRLLAYSVISNVLRNAVDTSLENEAVTIDLVRDELITLSIKNKGLVPEEILASFLETYRTSGNRRGTGIGLYSAKTFAEAQGWSIEITSTEPEGTILTMHMPAADERGKNRTGVPES